MGLPLKEVASCWQETDFHACNNWQRSCSADGEADCITVQLSTVHKFLASKTANLCSHDKPHWSWLIKPWKWNYISGITQRNDSCSQQCFFARLGPVTIGWFECCISEISKGYSVLDPDFTKPQSMCTKQVCTIGVIFHVLHQVLGKAQTGMYSLKSKQLHKQGNYKSNTYCRLVLGTLQLWRRAICSRRGWGQLGRGEAGLAHDCNICFCHESRTDSIITAQAQTRLRKWKAPFWY